MQTLTKNHFPFRDEGHKLKVANITLISKGVKGGVINPTISSNDVIIPQTDNLGNLHRAIKIDGIDMPIDLL